MHSRELEALFSPQVIHDAERLDITQIDPEAVASVATALLALRHSPTAQRQLINSMDRHTAVSLCHWLSTPDMVNRLVAGFTH